MSQDDNKFKGLNFVTDEYEDHKARHEVGEEKFEDHEIVTVQRPVDVTEKVFEIPLVKEVQSFVPRVTVHEVNREVVKEVVEYEDVVQEVPQRRIIDRYVEVPVPEGPPIEKRVPKIELIERAVEAHQPVVKWNERIIEVPKVHEVVRYVEQGTEIEQVIRYVPKGPLPTEHYEEFPTDDYPEGFTTQSTMLEDMGLNSREYSIEEPSKVVQTGQTVEEAAREAAKELGGSLSWEKVEVIRVEGETVQGEEPEVSIPVPYLVPKVVNIEIDTPVVKFKDHFVPVPVRRHVIPKITFTDEVYEVDCIHEKPILVVQDYQRPVPVNVKIGIREKDVDVVPIDPHELSQADMHAMWMRVNADLLELYQETHEGKLPFGYCPDANIDLEARVQPSAYEQTLIDEEQNPKETAEVPPGALVDEEVPLHPGHPSMLPILQNQWFNQPATSLPEFYTPDYVRLYNSALNAALDPKPHTVDTIYKFQLEEREKIVERPVVIMQERIIPVAKRIVEEKIIEIPAEEYLKMVPKPVLRPPRRTASFIEYAARQGGNVDSVAPPIGPDGTPMEGFYNDEGEFVSTTTERVTKEDQIVETKYRHTPVPVELPFTHYKPRLIERLVDRAIPIPVEIEVTQEYLCPKLEPVYQEVPVPIPVTRTIEQPVPVDAAFNKFILDAYMDAHANRTWSNKYKKQDVKGRVKPMSEGEMERRGIDVTEKGAKMTERFNSRGLSMADAVNRSWGSQEGAFFNNMASWPSEAQ